MPLAERLNYWKELYEFRNSVQKQKLCQTTGKEVECTLAFSEEPRKLMIDYLKSKNHYKTPNPSYATAG